MRKAIQFFGGSLDGKHRSVDIMLEEIRIPGPIVGVYCEQEVRAAEEVYDIYDKDAILRMEVGQ